MKFLVALALGMLCVAGMARAQYCALCTNDTSSAPKGMVPVHFYDHDFMRYVVIENYYGGAYAPVFFDIRWPDYWDGDRPLLALSCNGTEDIYHADSLTLIGEQHWPLEQKFRCHECMDGNWSWTMDMVDSLGISRGSIRRDCNQKLHAVVNDLQINLPERVQAVTKRREGVGDME